jgi:hypothetical protein
MSVLNRISLCNPFHSPSGMEIELVALVQPERLDL